MPSADEQSQVMSWICVALRLFVRFRVVRAPGWDDLLVVLSLVRPAFRLGGCRWVLPLLETEC
jgi:hypothetical protein